MAHNNISTPVLKGDPSPLPPQLVKRKSQVPRRRVQVQATLPIQYLVRPLKRSKTSHRLSCKPEVATYRFGGPIPFEYNLKEQFEGVTRGQAKAPLTQEEVAKLDGRLLTSMVVAGTDLGSPPATPQIKPAAAPSTDVSVLELGGTPPGIVDVIDLTEIPTPRVINFDRATSATSTKSATSVLENIYIDLTCDTFSDIGIEEIN